MTTRKEKLLTDAAQPIADKWAGRYGNLKVTMSAGIIALEMLSPQDRDKAFAVASGQEPPSTPQYVPIDPTKPLSPAGQEIFRQMIRKIVDEALDAKLSGQKHPKPLKSR